MPINFKKLKEVIKGKPAPSSFHQTKEYGENYKSQYKAEVQPTTKRHSAPSVMAKPPPPPPKPQKEHVSEYSQSQMNKDRPALAALKKKEKENKRDSHAPPRAGGSMTSQDDEDEHETAPPPPKKRTTPPTHVVPPQKPKTPPPPSKKHSPAKQQAPPAKQEKKAPETAITPAKKTPAKQEEAPAESAAPTPLDLVLAPAKEELAKGKPAVAAPQSKPETPTTEPTPGPSPKPAEKAKQEQEPAPGKPTPPPTPPAPPPTTEKQKPTPEAKRASASSPAPEGQKRVSASASPPATRRKSASAQADKKRQSASAPPTATQKRISANVLQSPQQKGQQSGKRSSNPPRTSHDEGRRSIPVAGKTRSRELPPLPTASELAKKPLEVSGYFASSPTAGDKRFYNLPTQFFFNKKKSEDGENDDELQSKKQQGQGKLAVKFSEGLPKQRFSLREGSMHLMDVTVHELPSPLTSEFEYDKYNDDSDEDDDGDGDFDLNFKDHLRSSFSIFPSDSLASIRRNPRVVHPETEREYCGHRKHFWLAFLVFVILFACYVSLTVFFIFRHNYGLHPASPPAILAANITLYRHEWVRVYTNYHMLIMILPRNELLGLSIQMYRLFPCITITNMKFVHGALSTLATLATVGGLYCSVMGKEVSEGVHFYSLHSLFGITSTLATLCSVFTGFSAAFPLFSWETRVSLIPVHRQMANLVFMSDTASILTGLLQVSKFFFDPINFPTLYFLPYHIVHDRSIVLNMIAILCLFFVAMPLYITSNYNFRRRREPLAKELKDPDQEQKEKVMTARRSRAKIFEARESEKGDDVQIGSRKSFNLRNKGVWKGLHHKGKSIALLINENEKRKANFTDTDLLLSLE